jgi:CheY-like chemotaxis protein
VPLSILLADDSVPAQNMGKKILVDAGYHVLTVSNGLEALRKIADTIPDIAILDIFMPGYTGLEVCERLRAGTATATLPVILTVGKLEPYRPEDGEHVHANAVIVKPFAAAELIAAVRSLIGAPPAEVADARPMHAGESRAVDTGADPLQKISSAEPLTLDHFESTHEPSAGPSHEEAPDDLLFSYGGPATPEIAAPWASQEANSGGNDLLLSSVDLNGPKSLVFDPDAGPTPFSASVTDLLPVPAESQFSAGNEASAFTEFSLEPEASHDPSEPALELSAIEESPFSAAAPAGQVGYGTTPALADRESQDLRPGSAVACEEAPLESEELEALTPDVPALDSWMELQEPAEVSEPGTLDLGEPAEEITSEVAPTSTAGAAVAATVASTSNAEQSVEEQEARRLAFEALFNSTEPLPEEGFYTASAEISSAMLPSMANLSENHSGVIIADSEIESLIDDGHQELVTPEPDPYQLQQEEPGSAASRLPDLDPLMDAPFETDWSGTESALEPMQAATANSGESDSPSDGYSPQFDRHSEPTLALPLEGTPAEAPLVADEALPAAPEILSEWAQPALADFAEMAEPLSEADPAQPTVPEIVYPAAQQGAPEPMPSKPELPEVEPPSVPEPEPVKEPEPQPAPVPPELDASELAESQSEARVAEISSAPILSPEAREAERIQQAVDRVFDRFKRLLVKAIVRELARPD